MKCFSTFCKIMKKTLMIHNNNDFFDELFYNSTNILEKEDKSLKSKYINGERPITPFLKKISKYLDVEERLWLKKITKEV